MEPEQIELLAAMTDVVHGMWLGLFVAVNLRPLPRSSLSLTGCRGEWVAKLSITRGKLSLTRAQVAEDDLRDPHAHGPKETANKI